MVTTPEIQYMRSHFSLFSADNQYRSCISKTQHAAGSHLLFNSPPKRKKNMTLGREVRKRRARCQQKLPCFLTAPKPEAQDVAVCSLTSSLGLETAWVQLTLLHTAPLGIHLHFCFDHFCMLLFIPQRSIVNCFHIFFPGRIYSVAFPLLPGAR